jgi:hypothetical protein
VSGLASEQIDALVAEGAERTDAGDVHLQLGREDGADLRLELRVATDPLDIVFHLELSEKLVAKRDWERFSLELRDIMAGALPGPKGLDCPPHTWRFRWTPWPPDQIAAAIERAQLVAAPLNAMWMTIVDGGDRNDAVAALRETLGERQSRGELLQKTFVNHSLLRVSEFGLLHVLAHRHENGRPTLVAVQRDVDLFSPAVGRGFHMAIGLQNGRSNLAERLIEIARRKFGIRLEIADANTALRSWGDGRGTIELSAKGSDELDFTDFVDAVRGLLRFGHSTLDHAERGADPVRLLGASEHEAQTPEVKKKPEIDWGTPPEADESEINIPGFFKNGPPAVEKPEPPRPPKVPGPAEILARIEAEGAEKDIFLSRVGNDPEHVAKIMAILLSVSADEATLLCERAPCLLEGPVASTRAKMVKTVLAGAGATVRIVDTAEAVAE